jgi:hypothetical protein
MLQYSFFPIIEINKRVSELDQPSQGEDLNMISSTSPIHGYVKRKPIKYSSEWNLGPRSRQV